MTREPSMLLRRRIRLGILLAGSLSLLGACAATPASNTAMGDMTPSSSQAADT